MRNAIFLFMSALLVIGSSVQSATVGFNASGGFLKVWHQLTTPNLEQKFPHIGFHDATTQMTADFAVKRQTLEVLLDQPSTRNGYHLSNDRSRERETYRSTTITPARIPTRTDGFGNSTYSGSVPTE